jgi:hypothetical protein
MVDQVTQPIVAFNDDSALHNAAMIFMFVDSTLLENHQKLSASSSLGGDVNMGAHSGSFLILESEKAQTHASGLK